MKKPNSLIGGMLNDANVEGYLFMHKVSKVNYAKGFLKKVKTSKKKYE